MADGRAGATSTRRWSNWRQIKFEMIRYLTHDEIDKARWDQCLESAVNRRIYAFSWYLDIVSPGWEALVKDDYSALFPLTHFRKWSVRYLAQPFFAQQLGIFSAENPTAEMVSDFILHIPDQFRFVEIHLNSQNSLPELPGEQTARTNYELDLHVRYEALLQNFSTNARRNIRKGKEAGNVPDHNMMPQQLVALFRDNFGVKEGKLHEQDYAKIVKLIRFCVENQKGFVVGSGIPGQPVSSGAFFLFDHTRVYFLFAASAPEARKSGSMYHLINQFITDYAGSDLILDFEGGNDPELGRFYKGFGALATAYPMIRINRLSKVANGGLNFIRKIRKS